MISIYQGSHAQIMNRFIALKGESANAIYLDNNSPFRQGGGGLKGLLHA